MSYTVSNLKSICQDRNYKFIEYNDKFRQITFTCNNCGKVSIRAVIKFLSNSSCENCGKIEHKLYCNKC